MPQPEIFKPNRTGFNYSVELYIGTQHGRVGQALNPGLNITKFLRQVRIVYTVDAPWPQIIITANIAADDLIKSLTYGQKELTMVILATRSGSDFLDRRVYHLMYVESNINLMSKVENEQNQADRQPTTFTCIPIYSINLMGSFVNCVLDENNAQQHLNGTMTPLDVFEALLNKSGFTNYTISRKGANDRILTQACVPPMSVKQTIDFMHSTYAFYQGTLFRFCDEDGHLYMWDLREKIKEKPEVIVFQLPAVNREEKYINEIMNRALTSQGKVMICRDPIETVYHANYNILTRGHTNVEIGHPDTGLYNSYNEDVESAREETIHYHPWLKSRKTYQISSKGANDSVISRITESTRKMLRVKVTLRKNIYMNHIFKVGSSIQFNPTAYTYAPYSNNYIIESTDYILTTDGKQNWTAVCAITMFRPNQDGTQNA